MKKQILILAITFTAGAFFSCSKEKIETQQTNNSEEIATVASRPVPTGNLDKGLRCLYEFNNNLKDKTGKLNDAVTGAGNVPVYTADRKGRRLSAMKFEGKFGATIFDVPLSTKMSLAVWVKYDSASSIIKPIAYGSSGGPGSLQVNDEYIGYNSNNADNWIGSGAMDNQWHHLVITMDAVNLTFYVDGNIVGSKLRQGDAGLTISNYYAGGNGFSIFWSGAMDDLRIYGRILTVSEVQNLYNVYN